MTRTQAVCFLVVMLVGWSVLMHSGITEDREQHRGYMGRIHAEGEEAGSLGIPVEACPYGSYQYSSEWKQGWIEGFKGAAKCPSVK